MQKPRTSLDEVMSVAQRLAVALYRAGHYGPAAELKAAVVARASPPERLLGLRSALIATRPEWERCAGSRLRSEAVATLAAAKRLSIEM